MERIRQAAESDLWFDTIGKPYEFVSPFNGEEYVVLLAVNTTNITDDEQVRLSDSIVTTGCRYAVCTGHECSSWDDSIDYSYIHSDPNCDPPREKFVMTTWHEDESIEDIVEYFRWNTVFDDFVPKNFLILFVGASQELFDRTMKTIPHFFDGHVTASPRATDL